MLLLRDPRTVSANHGPGPPVVDGIESSSPGRRAAGVDGSGSVGTVAVVPAIEVIGVDCAGKPHTCLLSAVHTAARAAGVRRTGYPRMRWTGHTLRAGLAIGVDPALTVGQAHRIAHDVERRLVAAVPRLAAGTVHTQPDGG